MNVRRRSTGERVVWIGLVGILVVWGAAAVVTAPSGAGRVPLALSAPAHPHPDLCDLPCGGTGDFETITVEVTGVPQFYTLAGGCEAYPANVANCQVFVPLDLAYTSTTSTQGDIQEIPVEPGNHAYTFLEPVGGTGFYASYNVDECNLPVPWNGCFNANPPYAGYFNHPGVDTSPYYYVGPAATKFVPGCNGAPFGQIFGPNAEANGATTIVLTYDDCPGTPADDSGGDGGNSSWNDTNGSSDPCLNETDDLDCLNATLGDLNLTDDESSATPTCPTCYTLLNDTIPVRVLDHGVVSAFLWNGSYAWNEWSLHRVLTDPGGTFTMVPKARESLVGGQIKTHPLTFSESGLPTGTNWSLWVNGTSVTTSNTSLTVREPNGTVPWFALETALGDGTGRINKVRFTAVLAGSNGTADYGNVVVAGDTNHDLVFERATTTVVTFAGAPAIPGHNPLNRPAYLTFCAAVRPSELKFSAGPFAADVPGIEACSVGGAHPALSIALPAAGGAGRAGVALLADTGASAASASQAYLYSSYAFETAPLKHPTSPTTVLKHPTPFSPPSTGTPGSNVVTSVSTGTFNVTDKAVKMKFTWAPVANAVTIGVECDSVPNSGKTVACGGSSDRGKTSFCTERDLNGDGIPDNDCARFPTGGSSPGNVTLGLINGTYNLTIAPIRGYWTNVGGVTIHGRAPASLDVDRNGGLDRVTVNFVPRTYNVTFSEAGLPPGTAWALSLPSDPNPTDPTHDWTSTTGSITVALPNGTAKFTVVAVPGYTSTAKPSPVKVHGAAAQVAVMFVASGSGGGAGLPAGPLGLLGALGVVPAGSVAGRRAPGPSRAPPRLADPSRAPSRR